jgi:uncharacterized membrane protein
VTVLESLKNRAGLIVSGVASFVVLIGGMRLTSGEPLIQPQTDLGIVIGIAMVALYFVLNDTRGGGQ